MSELVYNIENIFSANSRDGVLKKNKAEKYFIAPYQRGYKWASNEPDKPVWLLLTDIIQAFNNNEEQYLLQYITIKKKTIKENVVLEIIDGQQRLTTLTLLFAVISDLLKIENTITKNKLSYQVRAKVTEFFDKYIYNSISKLYEYNSWNEFIKEFPNYNEQDIYYLFQAVKRIKNELSKIKVEDFLNYIKKHIAIIVNDISDSNINAEKVFGNLNDNKVELTDTELTKALFITTAGRELETKNKDISNTQMSELRFSMGQQWDEMTNWHENTNVKSFYFKNYLNPMEGLLFILAKSNGYEKNNHSRYNLFNFFQKTIRDDEKSANKLFFELKEIKSILENWFNNRTIHNYLGFLFFNKTISFELVTVISFLRLGIEELKTKLKEKIREKIPEDISKISYSNAKDDIHTFLLYINVFGNDSMFDFKRFSDEKWSLEHIFPQTPENLSNELKKQDITFIKSLLKQDWEAEGVLEFKQVLLNSDNVEQEAIEAMNILKEKINIDKCTLTEIEKQVLYKLIKTKKLHNIGNMALLTSSDNSSNANGMFDAKRHNIVERISKGSFVPKHTYDVFSKLIDEKMTSDLTIWNENDIDTHYNWLEKRKKEIVL